MTLNDQIGEAIGLGLGMLAGAFVGFLLFTPIVGSDLVEDMSWSIIGIAVGTVAGAVGWKIYAAYYPYPPPDSSK
jgi:hypothetical protein